MKPRRLAVNLAVTVASVCLLGLCAEVAARVFVRQETRKRQAALRTQRPISRHHPVLGWDKTPGAEARVRRREFDVLLKFNSRGLRGPDRGYEKRQGVRRVLLLGDSFAEGYYVDEADTVRAVLEGLLGNAGCGTWEVINGGTVAYSTDQEYLFLRTEGRRYEPDVVLLLFYYNDLYYNASAAGPGGEAKPYFVVEDGRLVLRGSPASEPVQAVMNFAEPGVNPPRPWRGSVALRLLSNRTLESNPRLHRFLSHFGLVEPLAMDPPREFWPYGPGHRLEVAEMWRTTDAILAALQSETASSGSRLCVLYVPARFEINERVWQLTRERYRVGRRWDRFVVFDRLEDVCRRLGVPLLDVREELRLSESAGRPTYHIHDVHWNEVGNAIAAHTLFPFVASECRGH